MTTEPDKNCLRKVISELYDKKTHTVQTLYFASEKLFTIIQIKECLLELLKYGCVSYVKNRWQLKNPELLDAFITEHNIAVSEHSNSTKDSSQIQESTSFSREKTVQPETPTAVVEETMAQPKTKDNAIYPEAIIPTVQNGMYFVLCPQCGTSLSIIQNFMGKKVECAHCALKFRIASKIPVYKQR